MPKPRMAESTVCSWSPVAPATYLGLLDFTQTLNGQELRQLDVIAVNDIGSVVLSFIAPISSFDELLPEFESSVLSLHTI